MAERENTNKKPPAKIYGTGAKLEFEIRERNGVGHHLSRSISSPKNCRLISFFLSFIREFGSFSKTLFYESRALDDRVELARAVLWKRGSWIIQNLLVKVGRRGEWTRAMMALVVEEGVENAVHCAAEQHTGGSSAGPQLEIMGRELKCAIW